LARKIERVGLRGTSAHLDELIGNVEFFEHPEYTRNARSTRTHGLVHLPAPIAGVEARTENTAAPPWGNRGAEVARQAPEPRTFPPSYDQGMAPRTAVYGLNEGLDSATHPIATNGRE